MATSPSRQGAFSITFRALNKDGHIWCETRDWEEVLESIANDAWAGPFKLQYLITRLVNDPWEDWDGNPPKLFP